MFNQLKVSKLCSYQWISLGPIILVLPVKLDSFEINQYYKWMNWVIECVIILYFDINRMQLKLLSKTHIYWLIGIVDDLKPF